MSFSYCLICSSFTQTPPHPCSPRGPHCGLSSSQDLHKLRALFHAEGEGLDRELIDAELERLRKLLPLMSLEVGPLMDLIKTVSGGGE